MTEINTRPPLVARFGHCVTHQFEWFANSNGHGLYRCTLCNVVHFGEPHENTSTGCFERQSTIDPIPIIGTTDDEDDRNP